MRNRSLLLAFTASVSLMVGLAAFTPADAQVTRHQHRHGIPVDKVSASPAPVAYRGLTINREPGASSDRSGNDRDIYQDGPIRYDDIRDFSPSPYTTSGVQFPFGLDGIGGFGSDLGFGAGQDAALYNRGAGSVP